MRILRLSVLLLFAVTVILGIATRLFTKTDATLPSISLDSDTIHVELSDGDSALLSGVSAYDEKDGDLTDRIIVESVSHFVDPGVSIVTYAVCDSDDHVAKISRKVVYDDYTPPRFTLSQSLVFGTSQSVNIPSRLGALDSIDGDIGNRVIITSTDYQTNTEGVFYISARVTNSMGDTASLELPVFIEKKSVSAPIIELEKYLEYVDLGGECDIYANLISAHTPEDDPIRRTDLTAAVRIDSDLDTNTAGTYSVHYYVTDIAERTAHEIFTVVVR